MTNRLHARFATTAALLHKMPSALAALLPTFATKRPPHAPYRRCNDHTFILNPGTTDRLSCMYCPEDRPLPKSWPADQRGRIASARAEGLIWGQGGRSQDAIEAA